MVREERIGVLLKNWEKPYFKAKIVYIKHFETTNGGHVMKSRIVEEVSFCFNVETRKIVDIELENETFERYKKVANDVIEELLDIGFERAEADYDSIFGVNK